MQRQPDALEVESAPAASRVPTRRAFLIAGVTFSVGAAVGGTWGYGAAIAGATEPTAREEAEPFATEDPFLAELRALAVAPIDELIAMRLVFLKSIGDTFRRDVVLWRGFDRLVDRVFEDPAFPDRRISARLLAQTIANADATFRDPRSHLVGSLRSLR